ncbi:kinesin-like protein KIF26A isoform X4 [Pygocentrus nattereri]|uniref:Kinesin motor domain-containing protein n=1 Tax=Pygocentrus nattereri TaxID=42514 RepID=A0A3B4DPK9_PYGNA|nr:kinesin-like protein KIF26A isoform X4 [Pygocentrus nattereri]
MYVRRHAAGGRKMDNRRFTVVEGSAGNDSLQCGGFSPRKRLNSAEELQRGQRPNPEGSGASLCQRCQLITAELHKQALELAAPETTKDPGIAALLLDKLQAVEWPPRGRGAESCCEVCGTPLHQLRRWALHSALGLGLNDVPDLQPGQFSGLLSLHSAAHSVPSPHPSWDWPKQSPLSTTRQHSSRSHGESAAGVKHREMGWIKSGAAGTGIKPTCLATVTPLPVHAQHYLEGVWSVTRVSRVHQQQYTQNQALNKENLQSEASRSAPASTVPSVCPTGYRHANQGHSVSPPASQGSSAASFFLRAAQKLNLSKRKKLHPPPPPSPPDLDEPFFYTEGFSATLQVSPPPVPPCLLRAGSKVKDSPGMGKVKVMVRICPAKGAWDTSESMSFLKVDVQKKQLTFCEPPATTQKRFSSTAAPKTFNFDAVFAHDASQAEVCSGTVAEVIQSVVNGADGCIFCFGHANLGKTYTMIGKDSSTQSLGVAPCAISWLFKLIEERKEKAGVRFSVRVSAVEISGREEVLTDLLADFSPGTSQDTQRAEVYLREDPVSGSQLQNQSELRACSAERAAFFLDTALAARSTSKSECEEEQRRNSHMLFTLHVTQYRMEKSAKGGMSGGRSRLHLLDLGSCEADLSRTRDGGGGQCLSLAALGNVILALANGAKHVPYRDSKLTMLLRESLGNINCRTTMIAHISDSPANYTESLSTVQLASRIHRMRKKKSKYTSSSSGGESSCEEGQIRRPAHLRPFHPRTVALDPDHPTVLSSDPDYSSSSEHSCDTVIYVGPGGATISDRELSDNEGPPAFVPIIPSLNKKRAKEAPKSDGDHLKCNTFAELQERLECIDGSESTSAFTGEGRAPQTAPKAQSGAGKVTEGTPVSPKTLKSSIQKSAHMEHFKLASDGAVSEPSRTSAQDSEPVVREKVYLSKGPLQKPHASLSLHRTSDMATDSGLATRTPPVGMSQQALRQGEHAGSPVLDQTHHLSRSPLEVSHLRAALRSRCLDRDVLRTTVTLQQPVELNGEDELVFTVVEELPAGLVPDNGRPSSIISFNSDCSLQALASGSRPVSIISSINDEFDAYTAQIDRARISQARSKEELSSGHSTVQLSKGSWPSKTNVGTDGTHSARGLLSRGMGIRLENTSTMDIPGVLSMESFSHQGTKSSFSESAICFSELDYEPVTSEKVTKCPPPHDTAKTSLRGQKHVKSSTLSSSAQIPGITYSTLPRKNKPTSSVASTSSCSHELQQQGNRTDDQWMHTSGQADIRNTEFISAGKPSKSTLTGIPSRKMGGNSNSVPRSPKLPISSSSQRVVDGCEKSSVKKGESLSRMPQLRRGATTLGMVSVPQSSTETKWGHDTIQTSASLKFSSLGKRTNGQKGSMLPKSGSMSPPAPPLRKSSLDQRTRVLLSPSALRSLGNDAMRSSSSKASISEEDFDVQFRGESFNFKSSSLKAGSSLQTRGTKGDTGRYFGSLLSLERCDSLTSVRSKQGTLRESSSASLGSNGKSSRTVPRLGVTSSTSLPISPPSSTYSGVSKLGQIKASITPRAIANNGTKTKSLSTNVSKALSSTKSISARNASLPPTGKTPSRSVLGANGKPGKGTIMGTKQAVRAANSRVSELASGSSKKHIKGTGDQASDFGSTPSDLSMPAALPSPYSKITAPRRPQRYSSGHGSDNSSVLSGELPPAMGRTALFYHSGGSSGYESMIRDSETTGSASSAHDSMSESGVSTSSRAKVSKSPKKRANGLQRRRLIPAPLPDTSSLGRKAGAAGQWVDLPPLGGTLKEAFEIKVYEIDDVERLQRRKEGMVTEGLQYFNARLRMLEKRQQQIRELRAKHERLKRELEDAKTRLMLDPAKWMGEFDVDPDLDQDSQDYLEALAQATGELEFCVNLCKSRVMMETCFDIMAPTSPGQEMEV